jgi:magnesium-transporting ATPase (P-type)
LVNKSNWVRRRWLDFRQGHTVYLVFLMTSATFITTQYVLLIERIPSLVQVFPNIWIFAVVLFAVYMPLAIIVGYWHRKSQWKIEQDAAFRENVIGARMWLFMLELIEGNVTEEEKREVRTMLKKIMKKNPTDKIDRLGNAIDDEARPAEQQKEDIQK